MLRCAVGGEERSWVSLWRFVGVWLMEDGVEGWAYTDGHRDGCQWVICGGERDVGSWLTVMLKGLDVAEAVEISALSPIKTNVF